MKRLKNFLNKEATKTVGIVLAFFILFASIIYAHPGILHFDFSQKLGANSQTPTPTIDWSGYNESDIINQINQVRSGSKVVEVTTNEKLTKAADDKLDDLIEKNYWENNSPEGTTPWVILESNGYNYEEATMLLARGYNSAKEVVDGWLDSTSKDYLLDKKYSNAGVAIKTGTIQGNSSKLVVLYLASPKVTYTNNTKTTSKNIDCIGPDGKHFKTTQSECDKFNAAWGKTKDVASPPPSFQTPQAPSYTNYVTISCTTLYGTYIEYGKDYAEANKYCLDLQNQAIALKQNQPTYNTYPTYAPYPTAIPTPNNTDTCNTIRSQWISFRESFMANNYNNYNSSSDAIQALAGYLQQYQQSYSNNGCSGSLSLY